LKNKIASETGKEIAEIRKIQESILNAAFLSSDLPDTTDNLANQASLFKKKQTLSSKRQSIAMSK
jgi:hypothetical protein